MSNTGIELVIPCGDFGFDVNFVLTDSICSAFDLSPSSKTESRTFSMG